MTDRDLTADMAEHARREAGQPEPDGDQLARIRALMFNAVSPALGGFFVPLSRRQAVADALLAILLPELGRLEQHVEELQDKLLSHDDHGGCGCSFDDAGDVCMPHSPTVKRLTAERDEARAEAARLCGSVLHFAAEAHRRKWAHSNGGQIRPTPAFDELHQLGNELRALADGSQP